jgi:hydroxymethylpyrimidine/phosphomethylpyrimidine kinase
LTTTAANHFYAVPAEWVDQQLNDVISDILPKSIKTGSNFYVWANLGMLASKEHISVVAKVLAKNSIASIVDPVFCSPEEG